jgi:DNA-binding response OmpR family regulator
MKDILIVEDGKQERERLTDVFMKAGYTVVACESVTQAEQTLQYDTFRLAVLDIGLSDKSGSYLFNTIKRAGKVSYIIIFTGNPSVHLKQRFIDEGAADYIVKGSPQALGDAFLNRIRELLGAAQGSKAEGIPLDEFLQRYIPEKTRRLFLNDDNSLPECSSCSSRQYLVTFDNQTQVPPQVVGLVVCAACSAPLDPQIK